MTPRRREPRTLGERPVSLNDVWYSEQTHLTWAIGSYAYPVSVNEVAAALSCSFPFNYIKYLLIEEGSMS